MRLTCPPVSSFAFRHQGVVRFGGSWKGFLDDFDAVVLGSAVYAGRIPAVGGYVSTGGGAAV